MRCLQRTATVFSITLLCLPSTTLADVAALSSAGQTALSWLKRLQKKPGRKDDLRVFANNRIPNLGGGGGFPQTWGFGEERPSMDTFDSSLGFAPPGPPLQGQSFSPLLNTVQAVGNLAMPSAGPSMPHTKALTPMEMLQEVGQGCQEVPKLLLENYKHTECSANATEFFELTKWIVSTFAHLKAGDPSPMPKEFKDKIHQISARTCGKPECEHMMKALIDRGIGCQTAATCALESQHVPVGICKMLFGKMFGKVIHSQMSSMCEVETTSGTYCQEVAAELMVEHMDCWVQFHNPLEGCTPECAKVWADTRAAYPHCSMGMASKTVQMNSVLSSLTSSLGLSSPEDEASGMVRSSDEICTDLSFQGFPSFQV
jgi:hypothetical protein